MRRTLDWLQAADAALSQARDSKDDGHYWAACFFAHQVAEYAEKALLESLGIEARGRSVGSLLDEAREPGAEIPGEIQRKALSLGRHHLQSRYVNTLLLRCSGRLLCSGRC